MSTTQPYSLREQRLINALQAIVRETMDYPPVRPVSGFSSLPSEMVVNAQKALGGYGLQVVQARVAA